MDDTTGTLDEALERIHVSGPERDGWLSNHAPMAVEALVRHGQASAVHRWLDRYGPKLEEMPVMRRPGDRPELARGAGRPAPRRRLDGVLRAGDGPGALA